MAKDRKKRKKTIKVRRLYELHPFENAFVGYGANDRPFAVIKEASNMKIDAKAFFEALGQLQAVGNVLKSGTLDETATKEVVAKIGGAIDVLAKAGALEALDNTRPNMAVVKDKVAGICGELDRLTLSLQSVDLNLADYCSAVKEHVQEAFTEAEQAPPPPAPEIPEQQASPAAPAPAAPAPQQAAPEPAPAATPETPPEPATPTETPPEQQAAPTPPAPEATPAAPAAAPEEEPTEDEAIVTKADLEKFGKDLVSGMLGQMKELVETTVQKSVSALPATQPTEGVDHQARQGSAFNMDIGLEQLDFGSTVDMSKFKLPGDI